MSDKYPECPLYNPLNCKEYFNPKLCAFTRKDRLCQKKRKPKTRFEDGSIGEDDCGELINGLLENSNPLSIRGGDPELS